MMAFSEFFKDKHKLNSMGRLVLICGLALSTVLSICFFIFFRNSQTPTVIWDWAICATPAIIGLLAYIFSKLYDVKEWVVDSAERLKK